MKFLVTGASGFVGSAVTKKLLQQGHFVRAFVRSPEKLRSCGVDPAEIVKGDITDRETVREAVQGMDVVFAIAGTFREPNLSDEAYRKINVEAVRYIIEEAKKAGAKRVVHCSTVGIHGSIKNSPADESHPKVPDGIYEITKAEGDQLALTLGKELGIEVVVLRPTPIYGPGDTRLLKLFKMASKSPMLMLGDGKAGYHLVHVDDLAQAFLLAAEAEHADGEAFIIGGEDRPSINEMVSAIKKILGNEKGQTLTLPATPFYYAGYLCELVCRPFGISPPIYRRRVEFFTNNRSYSINKAKSKLGYQPAIGMNEGLKQTADWYAKQGLL